MKLIIHGRFPGSNEIIKAAKHHHMKYSNMKKEYTELVAFSAKSQGIPKYKRADFLITWIEANQRRDKDNISGGGTKFILDGLQAAGVIENDGWKQVNSILHRFEVDKLNPRIEIEIVEVQNGKN